MTNRLAEGRCLICGQVNVRIDKPYCRDCEPVVVAKAKAVMTGSKRTPRKKFFPFGRHRARLRP